MENNKISWSKTALKQFKFAIGYIAEDSIQKSEIIQTEILEKIERLSLYPEIYSIDKFKINNDGSYRAFELYSYRVSYRLLEGEVRILRIIHTSRRPKDY